MTKTILVIAAHTDDEALGCGGTMARHAAEGDHVITVFLADGVSSRSASGERALEERTDAAEMAQRILGVCKTYYLGLPDNRLDSLPLLEVVQPLEDIINEVRPEIIYTHHHGDLNVDHRITHQAVMTACRPMPGSCVKEIYAFEVMSSTDWNFTTGTPFRPNCFVDIADYVDTKEQALKAYALEMREFPHSRSFENLSSLAMHRGAICGVRAAEAFMLIRNIKK